MGRTLLILLALLVFGCQRQSGPLTHIDEYPGIYPDYVNITIPVNIAPLNFKLREKPSRIGVRISGKRGSIEVESRYKISIPLRRWRTLLAENAGDYLTVEVRAYTGSTWYSYRSFRWNITDEPVDPCVTYRLIEPGYEVWNRITICQRDLSSFKEKVLADNNLTGNNCINCHIFSNQDPGLSFFHMRGEGGGTIIQRDGKLSKLDTSTDSTISPGVYGNFHPSGRYIAFSTNVIIPEFHSVRNLRLEVYDTVSDLVVLDLEKNELLKPPVIADKNAFETFPVFSADGKRLFFCSAPRVSMPAGYRSVRYSLCGVDFNPADRTFGTTVDTLVSAWRTGRSVSEPRTSPDGRYLMYTSLDYGNFPIWHMESDLMLLDLETGVTDSLKAVNSDRSDTYHSWSSDSRWFVFASKRDDGMYGKLYLAYIDQDGTASKAFLIPQKDADFYDYCLKSFNIPEISRGPVQFGPAGVEKVFRKSAAEKVKFVSR